MQIVRNKVIYTVSLTGPPPIESLWWRNGCRCFQHCTQALPQDGAALLSRAPAHCIPPPGTRHLHGILHPQARMDTPFLPPQQHTGEKQSMMHGRNPGKTKYDGRSILKFLWVRHVENVLWRTCYRAGDWETITSSTVIKTKTSPPLTISETCDTLISLSKKAVLSLWILKLLNNLFCPPHKCIRHWRVSILIQHLIEVNWMVW